MSPHDTGRLPSRPPSPGSELLRALLFVAAGVGLGLGVVRAIAEESPRTAQVGELYERGMQLQRAQRTDAALETYRSALALDPNHVPTLYEIGWSYWVLGRWDEVVGTWERVLKLDPKHEDAARFLPEARANAETAKRLAEAVRLPVPGPEAVPRLDGDTLRLALGGDTMMGSTLTNAGLPAADGAELFAAFAETMRAADLAFLNLEGTLLDSGRATKCSPESIGKTCYAFRTPVAYARNLVDAGVDVVSVANNHANDFGDEGRRSTYAALRDAGVQAAGVVSDPAVLQHEGRTVGFLAFATSPGFADVRNIEQAAGLTADLARRADLVVVSFHGGAEGTRAEHVPDGPETFLGEDRGDLRRFARAVIDAGADLVVGHGPHVLRGMEIYKERLVAYSLGNFVTYGGFNLKGANGLSALLLVDLYPDGRFAGGQVVSGIQVPPGGPKLDPEHGAARKIAELTEADFGAAGAPIDETGRIVGPAAPDVQGGGHSPDEAEPAGDDDDSGLSE